MPVADVIVLMAVTLAGFACARAGMRGLRGPAGSPPLSVLNSLLRAYAPQARSRFEPALWKLEMSALLALGALLAGLGLYGLGRVLLP